MSYSIVCLWLQQSLVAVSLLTLLACRAEPPRAPARAALHSNPAAPSRSVTPVPAASAPPPKPPIRHLPLADRLASEVQARPARAIRASALVQALSSQGVAVAAPRQVLASPIGADYCESTVSASGLVLALCEFQSAADAQHGAQRSHSLFDALVPNRILLENDNALLTLASHEGAEATREAELARLTFLALEPATL